MLIKMETLQMQKADPEVLCAYMHMSDMASYLHTYGYFMTSFCSSVHW